jgi:hypothetical protein
MDIQTKDGILLRGIPDGTPDEVIKARIEKIRAESATERTQSKPSAPKESGYSFGKPSLKNLVSNAKSFGTGLLGGAADIGDTLINASTYLPRKIESLAGGDTLNKINEQRSQGLDSFNKQYDDDAFYGAGKLTSNIAGTAGVGNVLAVGAQAAKMNKLANALKSSGFSLGDTGGNRLVNAATRVAGAGGTGAASAGMVNPDDTLEGGVISAALPVVGKVGYGTAKTIGKAVAPLTKKGNNQILADVLLNKTGGQADDVIANLENAQGYTQGFNPTVGQASNSADLATLERMFSEANPSQFQGVRESQNEALANAMRNMGGDDLQRQALVTAREDATKGLYNQAQTAPVKMTPELQGLMQRPSMQTALSDAEKLALEKGQQFSPDNMTGADAQRIKMAMDDLTNKAPMIGIGGNELNSIKDTRQAYLGELEKQIPEYLQANSTFRDLSKPISQMDLGNEIANKYIPAIYRDVPSPNQLNHDQLAKVLRDNGDKLAQSVTGFKGSTLENTLSPEQLKALENAVKDTQYIKAGQLKGKPTNSSTFQNLAFNQGLEQEGILDGILPSVLSKVGGNVLDVGKKLVYGNANEKLTQQLADALLNPKKAAELMRGRQGQLTKQQAMAQLLARPEYAQSIGVLTAQ